MLLYMSYQYILCVIVYLSPSQLETIYMILHFSIPWYSYLIKPSKSCPISKLRVQTCFDSENLVSPLSILIGLFVRRFQPSCFLKHAM